MARRIARYRPTSILEVGCGYGKLIRAIRSLPSTCRSPASTSAPPSSGWPGPTSKGSTTSTLALASGARLPFADKSFDLVVTSAVILHNAPPIAEAIRREIVRVARRLHAAHNEDLDVTYNRYGYDTAAWYRDRGIPLAEVGPIPSAPYDSQFCVAELWHR